MINVSQIFGSVIMLGVSERWMNWWRKTTNVFDTCGVTVSTFQVLVEHGKNLGVQDLESPDSVHHSFQMLLEKNIHLVKKCKLNSRYK